MRLPRWMRRKGVRFEKPLVLPELPPPGFVRHLRALHTLMGRYPAAPDKERVKIEEKIALHQSQLEAANLPYPNNLDQAREMLAKYG